MGERLRMIASAMLLYAQWGPLRTGDVPREFWEAAGAEDLRLSAPARQATVSALTILAPGIVEDVLGAFGSVVAIRCTAADAAR